jgi:hypothetical protein
VEKEWDRRSPALHTRGQRDGVRDLDAMLGGEHDDGQLVVDQVLGVRDRR